MGIRDLWSVLAPHSERRPFYDLKGKVVAIDLAGWVCESLNTVDYFVHPRQYLKNLFFRTCYLLLEEVTPVFVLEGDAPELKNGVIAKRLQQQFRGVHGYENRQKPQEKERSKKVKRSRLKSVLKQCEQLLESMGVQCVQAPGEAEAFCAYLNKRGFVEGVVSQDSDCFAYGALKVYRNFSVCTQGNSGAQGGSVDVYDMRRIKKTIDIGQNKIIVMALLTGCDYCPEGVEGVGKDLVMKFFKRYKDSEILQIVNSWRKNSNQYYTLEYKVNDKNICSNCGHEGKAMAHAKKGCSICISTSGCREGSWKEERLYIKAEITIRNKALANADFPPEDVIAEFLCEPEEISKPELQWKQPNLIKFVNVLSELLVWPEVYCFQKFFPILTRWQIVNAKKININSELITPDYIKKKRVVKGVACYEIVWKDINGNFDRLIPQEQLNTFIEENSKGLDLLWTTLEPIILIQENYPDVEKVFLDSKQKKPKKSKEPKSKRGKPGSNLGAVEVRSKNIPTTQKIDKFLIGQNKKVNLLKNHVLHCSTPKRDSFLSDLPSDDDSDFNYSEIIQGITSKKHFLRSFTGKQLKYEDMSKLEDKKNVSEVLTERNVNRLVNEEKITSSGQSNREEMIYTDFNECGYEFNGNKSACSVSHQEAMIAARNFEEENENGLSQIFSGYGNNISFFFEHFQDVDEFEKSVNASHIQDPYVINISSSSHEETA